MHEVLWAQEELSVGILNFKKSLFAKLNDCIRVWNHPIVGWREHKMFHWRHGQSPLGTVSVILFAIRFYIGIYVFKMSEVLEMMIKKKRH